MACTTCDHTVQSLGKAEGGQRIFWCPRCGTLEVIDPDGRETNEAPKLPERVRLMLPFLNMEQQRKAWACGLYESCMVEPKVPS